MRVPGPLERDGKLATAQRLTGIGVFFVRPFVRALLLRYAVRH
jgi:hypothetical protein